MTVSVPAVEVANDGNGLRIRGPHGKVHAVFAVARVEMRAQLFVEVEVAALVE